jgi:hypothetical protein
MDVINKIMCDWMPQDVELTSFYNGINLFLKQTVFLDDDFDIERLKSKIIADPLVGYIYLMPLEVAIIDTNLYQRLRKIKQLGLAHYIFPTLSYSRFEHSIGVLGRLNQILNKLIENHENENEEFDLRKIIAKHIDAIRLAALLHDIGHCLFSHCSERIINNLEGTTDYPSSEKIRELFSKHFKEDNQIPFAEIFAVTLIGSKHFLDFIIKLDILKKKDASKTLENCCRFILGLPAEDEPDTVFLAQLISSGLDADKIDYMLREQHYTGIKLEIDIDRILSKLKVFELHSFELPQNLEYLKKQIDADKKFKVLGFSKGGQFVFEEFCIARLALHVKVYLHQKVRAAESQLLSYLFEITTTYSMLQKAHNWLFIPESIIEFPDLLQNILQQDVDLFNTIPTLKDEQKKKLKNIDNRNLYSRAFAFGQINSFSEAIASKDLIHTDENFFDIYKEEYLTEEIAKEIKIVSKLLDKDNFDFNYNFIVDIPKLRFKSIQQGQQSIYFERPPLSPLKWTIPLDKIVIYFEENRALGYVFSERKNASIVGLATEKVIFELNGKVFSQAGNISKDTFDYFIEQKKILTEKNYYVKYPELKDISEYLKKADAAEKIKKIHENLSGFESFDNERITINRITTFVNQFPTELQEACLDFLSQIEILGTKLLEIEIKKAISKCSDSSIGISYLGGVVDSGARLSYNLRSIFEENNLEVKEINDSLIKNSDTLIIYDDNINSGLQLLNIFAELLNELNKLPDNINLHEKHVSALDTIEAKKKIKVMQLHFCYIVASDGIEEKIKKQFKDYLDFDPENIHIHINRILMNSEKVFNGGNSKFNHKDKLKLKEFFIDIGEQLLKNENKTEQKVNSCKLGYANAEATILFPYNIPTMTITAIWCKGRLNDDIPWLPLAERRRRKNKKGVYIGED